MITEPKFNKELISSLLRNKYRILPSKIIFIPKGETSWGYVVEDNEKKYFFKIYKNKLSFLEEAAQLTYKLFNECWIKEIVHALKDINGTLVNYIDKSPVILFNFIDGEEISKQRLTGDQIEEIGKIIGRIHQSTNKMGTYPKKEIFKSRNKDTFLKVMERVKRHEQNENSYQRELVELFNLYRSKIEGEFTKLQELGKKLRKKNPPFVICHSDPSPGNILLGKNGEIYLIDWDTPLLAPKERDLMFFIDKSKEFMEGYTSIVGEVSINEEVVGFYIHEWNIQEIADFGRSILFEKHDELQNRHYLNKTKEFLEYSGISKN